MAGEVPFHRPLHEGDYGLDVEGISRALCKSGFFVPIRVFQSMPEHWRRTYGSRRITAVNKLRKAEGWKQTGVYNEACQFVLSDGGYFDSRALYLLGQYKPPLPPAPERFRTALADFCRRAEAHESQWHYSQHRAFGGFGVEPEREHYADCSAYVMLGYFWAQKETGVNVPDPSGYSYKGWGNTWDDLDSHPRVSPPFQIGDLAHFEGHVMVCRKSGDASSAVFSSFGREAGPEPHPLMYRNDLRFICRPPLST